MAFIPLYLSAVCRMHELYTGRSVLPDPSFEVVAMAYGKCLEQRYSKDAVRSGVEATTMQLIWSLGMETPSLRMLRDSSGCVFVYCMNVFQKSSKLT